MGDRMAFSCRNCGKPQNRPGLKFCPDCGQPISGAVLPDSYRGTAASSPPGRRRFGLLAVLMVTAIALAGSAGALTGLLRSPPSPARLSAQSAPAPGPGAQPGTTPGSAGPSEADELQQLAAVVRQRSAARRITVHAT